MPAAPGRLSTTICWPRISLTPAWMVRATKSDAPPGANGTIIITGRFGIVAGVLRGGCRAEQQQCAAERGGDGVCEALP